MKPHSENEELNRKNAFDLGILFQTYLHILMNVDEPSLRHFPETASDLEERLGILFRYFKLDFRVQSPRSLPEIHAYGGRFTGDGDLLKSLVLELRAKQHGSIFSWFHLGMGCTLYAHAPAGVPSAEQDLVRGEILKDARDVGVPDAVLRPFLENPSAHFDTGFPALLLESAGQSKLVFIVHGRNHAIRDKVDLFLRDLGLKTKIMDAEAHLGRSLPEKFENVADECGFAVFILSGDDELRYVDNDEPVRRARQNVILEVGYFWGALGRQGRSIFLVEDDPAMELPSDLSGIGWVPITEDLARAKLHIQKELKAAGLL